MITYPFKNFFRVIPYAGIISISLLFCSHLKGQDCNFEVNAGPDIDVCQGGQVNLEGTIGGGANRVQWQGGKGTFTPGRQAAVTHYEPAPDEFGKEVKLVLVADNASMKCAPAKAEIVLRVNSEPEANAGADQRICYGEKVQLKGSVKGRAKSVTWISNGSG